MYIWLRADTNHSRKAHPQIAIVISTAPAGLNHTLLEGNKMKKVLALVVAATMGLSAAAFAADTTAAPATTTTAAPAKAHTAQTTHKKKHEKVEQKAQAAKKHHKKAAAKPASEPAAQKAQAAKKHHKTAAHKAAAVPGPGVFNPGFIGAMGKLPADLWFDCVAQPNRLNCVIDDLRLNCELSRHCLGTVR